MTTIENDKTRFNKREYNILTRKYRVGSITAQEVLTKFSIKEEDFSSSSNTLEEFFSRHKNALENAGLDTDEKMLRKIFIDRLTGYITENGGFDGELEKSAIKTIEEAKDSIEREIKEALQQEDPVKAIRLSMELIDLLWKEISALKETGRPSYRAN